MPLILPLLEQKQKQLHGNLQVGLIKIFHSLHNYFNSDISKSNPISEWDLNISPLQNSLTKVADEYDDVIAAISEELTEITEGSKL